MKYDVLIVAGARTPMATYNTHFKDIPETELGAIAGREAVRRSGFQPGRIDQVVFGNAMQTSANALYGARHVGLKAGLPEGVPALTVNRLCGSGLQSIVTAAGFIALSEAEVVLAGGMENMTQAPHVIRGARTGLRLGEGKLEDSLMVALLDTHCGLYMAQTSDNLARQHAISREDMDAYALRSQKAAAAARARGVFKDEIVPVDAPSGRKTVRVEEDDHLRPDTTLEGLAALKPSFGKDGFVTAGNASGIVDGAAALVVAHEDEARRRSLKPLARVVSWAVAGVPPEIMGIGPVPAVRKLLAKAGMTVDQIDLFEVNEAFASQALYCLRELALPQDRVNVNGGAIALGHPLGCTGARQIATALHELERRKGRYAVITMCVGGGMGAAGLIERAA